MTDTERKALALALVNKVAEERDYGAEAKIQRKHRIWDEALCRAIEQHEAFRQEVSDAIELRFYYNREIYGHLERFIIAKPDPLAEAIKETHDFDEYDFGKWADELRAAIKKRGGKIVWRKG